MKFDSEQIVCTRGVADMMADNPVFSEFVQSSINRHFSGNWGEVDPADKEANDYALTAGERLLSSYICEKLMLKLWIITEADRSATTALFPNEY
jgi:hypothetical protein